jgi:hypothetical protein
MPTVQDVVVVEGALASWVANSSILTTFIILLHQFFVVQRLEPPRIMPLDSKIYLITLFACMSVAFCVLAIYPYAIRILFLIHKEEKTGTEDDGVKPAMERVHLILLLVTAGLFMLGQLLVAWFVVNDAFRRRLSKPIPTQMV